MMPPSVAELLDVDREYRESGRAAVASHPADSPRGRLRHPGLTAPTFA
jgi:hypothetical protein